MNEIRLVAMRGDDLRQAFRWENNATARAKLQRAYDQGITEEEYRAADNWIVGIRRFPGIIKQGRLLDKFRRKGRAAFEEDANA
jgi:hypothetical protein